MTYEISNPIFLFGFKGNELEWDLLGLNMGLISILFDDLLAQDGGTTNHELS